MDDATDHGPRPIWENTEKDQVGRTLLWHGDCFRVIYDPNVVNQFVFENFSQFIVFCQYQKRLPQQLPWVPEVVARYDYLL